VLQPGERGEGEHKPEGWRGGSPHLRLPVAAFAVEVDCAVDGYAVPAHKHVAQQKHLPLQSQAGTATVTVTARFTVEFRSPQSLEP